MKKIIYFLLITILVNTSFAQNWSVVLSPDVNSELNDIFLINEQNGWIVGNAGTVLYTTNGGDSWEKKSIGFTYDLLKVFFVGTNFGWIGTKNGSILKTTDAGSTWNETLIASDFNYFDGIFFTSNNVGHIIIGKNRAVYLMRTTDGGATWSKRDSLVSATTSSRWYDVNFYNSDIGAVVGDKKDIQRFTTNGGITWNKSNTINDVFFRDLRAVRWLSSTEVITLGDGNEFYGVVTPIYKSTDGGLNWVKKPQSPSNNYDRVKGVYFKNSSEGIGVGNNGFSLPYITRTTDGGETWNASFLNMSFGLKAIVGSGNTLLVLGTGSHILKSADFGNTWSLYKWFTPNSLYGIQFIGGKGYAVNRYSDVYKNEDGTGNNWTQKSSAGLWETFAFRFVDANTGYLLKENRHIQKTTDGGLSWFTVLQPVPFSSRNKVGGITFSNPNVGYAWMSLNDYGEYHVFKTSDAGNNWTEILTIAGPGYLSGDIGFFDDETGFIAGPKRWMIRTSNGGASWDSAKFNLFPSYLSTKDFEDVFVLDNSRAWAIGAGFICYTYDKGANWYYLDHGIKGIDSSFYTIAFFQDTLGYIGCYDGTILKTTNGGSNWIVDTTFKNVYYLYSSAFNENGRIFFGTSNGRIIAGEQIVKVDDESNNHPRLFSLEQNFPNPFNSKTVINFQLMFNTYVRLKIYDVLGRELKTLIDKQLPAGSHTIELDAGDLSSGIYFYKLSTDVYSEQKKMVIVK